MSRQTLLYTASNNETLTSASNWPPVPLKHSTSVLAGRVGRMHNVDAIRPYPEAKTSESQPETRKRLRRCLRTGLQHWTSGMMQIPRQSHGSCESSIQGREL